MERLHFLLEQISTDILCFLGRQHKQGRICVLLESLDKKRKTLLDPYKPGIELIDQLKAQVSEKEFKKLK